MKIRTDFVTNSSSASYTIELTFCSDANDTTNMSVVTCSEDLGYIRFGINDDYIVKGRRVSKSDDRFKMTTPSGVVIQDWNAGATAFDPYISVCLNPKKKSFSSASNINELCDMLFEEGEISLEAVVNEDGEFVDWDDDDWDDWYEKGFEDEVQVSIKKLHPEWLEQFKTVCKDAGISLENLKTVQIKNVYDGHGESAAYISNGNFLNEYSEAYKCADLETQQLILKNAIDYVKSEPILEIWQGWDIVQVPLVWKGTEEELEEKLRKNFDDIEKSCWVGKFCNEYTIDAHGKNVTDKSFLLINKWS